MRLSRLPPELQQSSAARALFPATVRCALQFAATSDHPNLLATVAHVAGLASRLTVDAVVRHTGYAPVSVLRPVDGADPPLPPPSGPIGCYHLPNPPYVPAPNTKEPPTRPPAPESQWNGDPRLFLFLSTLADRGCGTLEPLPPNLTPFAPLDPSEFLPVRLLPRSLTKSIAVWDERWANAAAPWQPAHPPTLSDWSEIVALLLSAPPHVHLSLQCVDWSNCYWSLVRSDGRTSAALCLDPTTGNWHIFRTSRVTFGQHDAVASLCTIHAAFTAAATAATAPVPPPLHQAHVDDVIFLSWLRAQDEFAHVWVGEGEAPPNQLCRHPTKTNLSPHTQRVFVGKHIDTVERTVRNPPDALALACIRVFTLISRPWLSRRACQSLLGQLVWLTSHTRYHRSSCLAPWWRATQKARIVPLSTGLRLGAIRALAAAFLPLRGAFCRPSPRPYPVVTPSHVAFCDAQAPPRPEPGHPHRRAAAAVAVFEWPCLLRRHHSASCACFSQAIPVPLRHSKEQAHAEAFAFFTASAAIAAAPAVTHADVAADAEGSLWGLGKLKAPAFSLATIPLVSRLSRLLSRRTPALVLAPRKCPGGDANPCDKDARNLLASFSTVPPYRTTATHLLQRQRPSAACTQLAIAAVPFPV